jgi:hypothetical protein
MKKIEEKWISLISGSGCRPNGQTYPAIICDGIDDITRASIKEMVQKTVDEIKLAVR